MFAAFLRGAFLCGAFPLSDRWGGVPDECPPGGTTWGPDPPDCTPGPWLGVPDPCPPGGTVWEDVPEPPRVVG